MTMEKKSPDFVDTFGAILLGIGLAPLLAMLYAYAGVKVIGWYADVLPDFVVTTDTSTLFALLVLKGVLFPKDKGDLDENEPFLPQLIGEFFSSLLSLSIYMLVAYLGTFLI